MRPLCLLDPELLPVAACPRIVEFSHSGGGEKCKDSYIMNHLPIRHQPGPFEAEKLSDKLIIIVHFSVLLPFSYYQNIPLINCKIEHRCDYFQLNFQFSTIFQTNPFFTLLQMFDFAKLFTSRCGSESTAGVECSALIIETISQNHSKSRSGKPYIIYLPIICNVFSHSLL